MDAIAEATNRATSGKKLNMKAASSVPAGWK